MGLIIYPAEGADSFISVDDADTVINDITTQFPQWDAIPINDKEVYLRIAYRYIIDGIDLEVDPLTDPIAPCVPEAQAMIASQDLTFGFSSGGTINDAQVKKQKVASLEIEYFESSTGGKSAPVVPYLAQPCLKSIGFWLPASGMQTILGRS
jgi:hypothetical protein